MKSLTVLWRDIPKRHKLVLGVLLMLLVLLILLGLLAAGKKQTSLALPPLPQTQVAPSNTVTSQQPTTYEGNDLRISARRPVLTSPGLEFITSAPPVIARSTQTVDTPQSVPPTHAAQEQVAGSVDAPTGSPMPEYQVIKKGVPETVVKPAKTASPQEETRATSDSGKFASLPADTWLLQIAAVSNKQDAQTRCHGLSLPCTAYAAMRQGRQVWVLIAGPYASRADALAAVARLPASMQHGPFPRQAKDVRRDAGGG